MAEIASGAPAGLTGMSCPLCGERALAPDRSTLEIAPVLCLACGASHDAIADVTVLADRVKIVGGCCAGFLRHELRWSDAGGRDGITRFQTWAQDHVLLRPGDSASLLFAPGDLQRRKGTPMPLSAANHTLGAVWALPGSLPVERLR